MPQTSAFYYMEACGAELFRPRHARPSELTDASQFSSSLLLGLT